MLLGGCGNGLVEAGETCDDGNKINGDGCSSLCATESGWTCAGNGAAGFPGFSICTETKDGTWFGGLACDNGSTTEGCSATGTVLANWHCDNTFGAASSCVELCGNSVKQSGLATVCDDGNRRDGDGCSAVCTVETGYTCTTNAFGRSVCVDNTCGDGIDLNGNTGCEDGNLFNLDGCNDVC